MRFSDPATEFPLVRLTGSGYASALPAYYTRCVSRHSNFLLFSSDRTGEMQAYRMDLKNGETRLLTSAAHLDPASVTLVAGEHRFCYFDGGELVEVSLSNLHTRTLYRSGPRAERKPGFSIAEDGLYAAFVEREVGVCRLRLLDMRKGTAETVAESDDDIGDPMIRPRRAGILYRRGTEALWLASYDGKQNYRLRIAAGNAGPALWSPDGRQVLYLNFPTDSRQLRNIREVTPDANEEHEVAPTSQYAHFDCNGDATVFVGASASRASPYVLILLRDVKRELTLCEHKASDASRVAPIFSPNSQRIYFQSDRDGKWAIYAIAVERFVERTES